jgi:FHA domain-containing protein
MRPLAALERIIERLVERSSAKVFRTRIHPLQVQRRIERAMEMARRSSGDRTVVPSHFTVRLHPADMAELQPIAGSLAAELADGALTFARAHHYSVLDRPQVTLVANRAVGVGDVNVDARFEDGLPPIAAGADDPRPEDEAGNTHQRRSFPGHEHTMVFTMPQPDAPLAVLREQGPDGFEREIALDGRPVTIGRSADNDVAIRDSRVSRHHARLQARRGTLVLTDLGSTNGTRVNGFSVDEVVLGQGDRIQVGDTVLQVDSVSDT